MLWLQGIGRCIRHLNDFGAILLLDERFCQRNSLQSISRWVRDSVIGYDDFRALCESAEHFFKGAKKFAQKDPDPNLLQSSTNPKKQKIEGPPTTILDFFNVGARRKKQEKPQVEKITLLDGEGPPEHPQRGLPQSFRYIPLIIHHSLHGCKTNECAPLVFTPSQPICEGCCSSDAC